MRNYRWIEEKIIRKEEKKENSLLIAGGRREFPQVFPSTKKVKRVSVNVSR